MNTLSHDVSPSVRHTLVSYPKEKTNTTESIVEILLLHDSHISLVFSERNRVPNFKRGRYI